MNATDFDKIVGDRMEWCIETLCKKGDEYARNGDRLWNFKVAARKRDCRPAQALAGMMVKHTVSVDDIIDGLANGIVPPREMVAEKIGDSINYLLLLEGLVEEERATQPAATRLSTFSVAERGLTCSSSASRDGRSGASRSITRSARAWCGLVPSGASACALARRSMRAVRSSSSPRSSPGPGTVSSIFERLRLTWER